ncbi:MAG: hypothetical protein M1825_003810 [Sarcosagium campestre]|nr:MAG: hypothetical protein M1825_003810 [Sarcosagium campestre]
MKTTSLGLMALTLVSPLGTYAHDGHAHGGQKEWVKQPYYVDTYVPENAELVIVKDLTIRVLNAPTHLKTHTHAWTTWDPSTPRWDLKPTHPACLKRCVLEVIPLTVTRTIPGATEPAGSTTEDPVASTTEAPVASTTEEPVASTTEEPVASTTEEPVASTTEEPVASTTEEPVASTTEEPPSEPTCTVKIKKNCALAGLTYQGFDAKDRANTGGGIFDAAYFNGNTKDLEYTGIADNINFEVHDEVLRFPGQGDQRLHLEALVFEGYFLAPDQGTYIFKVGHRIDDWGFIWTGDVALGSWGNDNYEAIGEYARSDRSPRSFPLQGGCPLAITVLYANSGSGDAINEIQVTKPDGTVLTDTSGLFVPRSCRKVGRNTVEDTVNDNVGGGIRGNNGNNNNVGVGIRGGRNQDSVSFTA